MGGLDEHGLIERYFRPLASEPGAFSLIDDAACYSPEPGTDLVITKDGIAEGIHFLPGEAAEVVARKALRVNLSDLAAKGATPIGYFVLLGLSQDLGERWVADFAAGLAADQERYGVRLFGGDTIRAPGLVVSVTAFGRVVPGGMVRRVGARPEDRLYVSGTIGDGALGLLAAKGNTLPGALSEAEKAHLVACYRLPEPRVALAPALCACATAALDVSDGLAGDLDKLCRASGVSARVEIARVPLSPAAARAVSADPRLAELCLTGGDDYEILCAVPPAKAAAFETAASAAGIAVHDIGEIVAGAGEAVFLDAQGRPQPFGRRAFSHVDSR